MMAHPMNARIMLGLTTNVTSMVLLS